MNEFFNWSGSWLLVEHHWMWMLAAAAIGIYVGWRTCDTASE
jgi:hypothetical protein